MCCRSGLKEYEIKQHRILIQTFIFCLVANKNLVQKRHNNTGTTAANPATFLLKYLSFSDGTHCKPPPQDNATFWTINFLEISLAYTDLGQIEDVAR